MSEWVRVDHLPQWEPADLRIDRAGNTRPGFTCMHELENGNGQCGGNTFDAGEIRPHGCMVNSGLVPPGPYPDGSSPETRSPKPSDPDTAEAPGPISSVSTDPSR